MFTTKNLSLKDDSYNIFGKVFGLIFVQDNPISKNNLALFYERLFLQYKVVNYSCEGAIFIGLIRRLISLRF